VWWEVELCHGALGIVPLLAAMQLLSLMKDQDNLILCHAPQMQPMPARRVRNKRWQLPALCHQFGDNGNL
jgi:hypothetical protein